jgi:hypothetical protein
MQDERKYSIDQSDLDVRQSFIQLQDYFIECGYEEDAASCNNIAHKIRLNEFRELNADDFAEFLRALEHHPHPGSIAIHAHWKREPDVTFVFNVALNEGQLEISVKSDDLNLITDVHEKAREFFKGYNPT